MDAVAQRHTVPERIRTALYERVDRIRSLPNVTAIYLYGSYAKGTQTPESDVDLAVFFDSECSDFLAEYRTLMKICQSADIEFAVQVFSDRELSDSCGIVEEVVTYGFPL